MFCHSLFVFCLAEQENENFQKMRYWIVTVVVCLNFFLSVCSVILFVLCFAEKENETSPEVSYWVIVCLVSVSKCSVAVCLSYAFTFLTRCQVG